MSGYLGFALPASGKFGKGLLSFPVTIALIMGMLTALPAGSAAATPGEQGQDQAQSRSVMAEARASGHRVEDPSQRDEVTQVFANPDGTWTAEVAPEAVRAKGQDGRWGDIDTNLEVRDGAVAPKLAASDVRFSAGGDRTFAAMTVDGRMLEWRWPGTLPEPVLDGDTATYPDAVAGGDLVVTATAEGFSHSVVLRERPEGPVDFSIEVVTPGANLVKVPEGGLEVQSPDGEAFVYAPAPLMWDSSENVVGDPEVRPLESRVDRESVGVSSLTLSPDEGFLSDPDTVYPVTIDPTITPKASGDTWLQKNSNTSSMGGSIELRAGTYDGGTHVARSFINFSSSSWSGREVISATLKLRNWDSTSCTGANIRVARITKSWVQSKLTWTNQPPASTATGDVDDFFQAYGASGCPTADASWNVSSIVQKWATGAAPNYGFKVFAKDETKNASWRKYRSANYDTVGVRPRLVITYNTAPGTPYELALSPCVGTCSPRVTDSLTPTFSGRAKDVDGDQLTYTFQVAPAASSTPIATGTVGPVAQDTKVSWQVPAGKLADDTSYQWRLGAKDARTTTWSGWLGFSVGADRPPAAPSQLSLYPCEGDCASLVSTSLNPDLTAVVTDPDSESVDAQFDVREKGKTEILTSGSDLVTSGDTARFTIEPGILKDGGSYQFQVTAKDAQSQTPTPTWTDFTVRVDTGAPGSSLRLAEPLVVWDQGPELTWTHYKDPSGAEGDDLVEYQVFRGCTSLPGTTGCAMPVGPDYSTAPNSGLELVGTVDRDLTKWTDESAQPSAADKAATYHYWVGARTRDDVAHSRVAQVASASQQVTTPRQGRVRRIFTGDPADPATVLDDVTISNAPTQLTASLETPEDAGGTVGKWIQVGNSHPTYGLERALLAFDLDAIDPGLTVTDARLELNQVGGGGSGATVELRELSQSFNETEANWTNATSGVLWTTPGGTMKPGALATVATDNTAKNLTLSGTTAQAVQGWVDNRTTNHGLALTTTSQTSQQWLNIASSEADDAASRPRLVVEHLTTPDSATIVAPQVPERVLPSTVTKVPVTVTNTTAETWPADMELSYRWTLEGGTADESTANSDRYVALGRALAPGESVQKEITLRAPINSATGEKLKVYDLWLDLMSPHGVWWSGTHDYTDHVLTTEERQQRLCTMVADGLLCPRRMVDAESSSTLGLEKFFSYAGEETGAGSQVLANLFSGNVVWSYDAMQNPSVGPSMFTRVIYNSLDNTGDVGAGHDWSVQVGTLNRLGTGLTIGGNNKSVTLVDGDGTQHIWYENPAKSTATSYGYQRPAGIALELTARKDPNDATKIAEWAFVRPDGTRFLYETHAASGKILPVSVTDTNGNALTFQHSNDKIANLQTLTDAKGRVVAELGWTTAGLGYIKDISNRALKFTYNSARQLEKLEDGGGFTKDPANPGAGTFADPTKVKTFTFGWTTSQQSSGTRLARVTDPAGASTYLDYYVATDQYASPDPRGATPSFIDGWPKSITDRMDRTTTFRYYDADGSDGNNILATVTDTDPRDTAGDEVTDYRIDGYGRTIEIKDANANAEGKTQVTRLGWDADHNVVRMTETNGAVSRWQYDPDTGYPLNIWDPEAVRSGGAPQTLCYGPPTGPAPQSCTGVAGQLNVLKSITSPGGKKTTFGHDAKGNLTSVTDPMGHTTRYTYNPDGTQASAADARQENPLAEPGQYVTTFGYDPAKGADTGYPTTITPPAGIAPTDFVYDARGNVTSTTQAGGNDTLTTTADYDAFGRPTRIEAPGAQGGRRATEIGYDLNDNVITTTAPNKAVTKLEYLADDQLKTATLPSNGGTGLRVETSTYDVMGRLATVTTPEGNLTPEPDDHVIRYDYDHLGQVTQVERPLAGPNGETATTSYAYDNVGNVIEVRDPRGNTSRMVYDLNGQQTAAIDAAGFSTRTRYGADGEVLAEIDQRGVPKTYDYYPNGLLKSMTVRHTPTGSRQQTWVTEYEYDEVGNQTKVIRPHNTEAAGSLFEETAYDANNLVIERHGAFDPNHANPGYRDPAVTYFRYDNLGRMRQQSAPTRDGEDLADWTDFTHYPSGEIKTSTDPWNISTSYEYNKLGLQTRRILTSASGAANRTMTWDYNADGSLESRDDLAAPTPATVVDNTDTTQVQPTGTWNTATTSTSKVGADYRTHPAVAAGSPAADDKWTWNLTPAEDGSYRVEVSCPAVEGATTAASYTVDADQVHNPQPLNQTRCSEDRTWHPLGSFRFTGGQPASVSIAVSADGTVVADAVRLVKVDNERSFTYQYDADGRQKTVINETAGANDVDTYTTTYDAVGQTEQVQELAGAQTRRTTTYAYDINGNITSVLANRGQAPGVGDAGNLEASRYTAYTWDERDLVATVTAGRTAADPNKRTWAYSYDPRGMKATWTKPAGDGTATGNVTTYAYHETGLLRSMVERRPDVGHTLVASHQLWFNPDGDRTRDISRVDNADTGAAKPNLEQTADYTYTPDRRLAKVEKTGTNKSKNETYFYDAAGNVEEQTVDGKATTFTYDRNRLVSSTTEGVDGSTDYQYDPFGRLETVTLSTSGQVINSYRYDGFDRVVEEKESLPAKPAVLKTSAYDPFDRTTLQVKTIGTQAPKKTRFNYLGNTEQVAVEEKPDAAGAWQVAKSYSYGPDGRPLVLEDTPVTGTTPETHFYSINPHGDTEALTDPTTGATTATYRYTAYGQSDKTGTTGADQLSEDPAQEEDVLNPYRFNSKRYDGATGDYDMGFRNYNPGLNRFLTRDMYNGALDDLALGTDPWNTNRYAFAGGNPMTGVELDGHLMVADGSGGGGYVAPPEPEEADEGGFWNTVSGGASTVWNGAVEFGKDTVGVAKGAGEGIKDTAVGLKDLGVAGWNCAGDLGQCGDDLSDFGSQVKNDPKGVLGGMWNSIKDPIVDDWKSGNQGEAIGRGAWGVVEAVFGAKGLTKLSKAGKAASGADDLARLTPSQQKSLRSLQRQAEEHRSKLDAYRADPDAFDNLGYLERAPSPEIRQRIIDGRIRHLETEIRTFQDQINKLLGGG